MYSPYMHHVCNATHMQHICNKSLWMQHGSSIRTASYIRCACSTRSNMPYASMLFWRITLLPSGSPVIDRPTPLQPSATRHAAYMQHACNIHTRYVHHTLAAFALMGPSVWPMAVQQGMYWLGDLTSQRISNPARTEWSITYYLFPTQRGPSGRYYIILFPTQRGPSGR